MENEHASLIVRAMPLLSAGVWSGSLLLLRDVTELRRRERELVTKEATIREIHHRVKNNLQTVAALLRLQSRRMREPEARVALEEATRRVGAIALVHETLSQSFDETVDFDDVSDRLRAMVVEVSSSDAPVTSCSHRLVRQPARRARDLAVDGAHRAAAERGRARVRGGAGPGRDHRDPQRAAGWTWRWTTTGAGCRPASTPTTPASLGIAIVRTLVESELGGRLRFAAGPERPDGGRPGTVVTLEVPLRSPDAVP